MVHKHDTKLKQKVKERSALGPSTVASLRRLVGGAGVAGGRRRVIFLGWWTE